MWQHIPFTEDFNVTRNVKALGSQHLFNMSIFKIRWMGVRHANAHVFLLYACIVKDSISRVELIWADEKKIIEKYFQFHALDTYSLWAAQVMINQHSLEEKILHYLLCILSSFFDETR